jgi:uncharacterized protein YbbC (DUF1343 family)
MTMGELAKLFVAERKLTVDLTVVPVQGWQRSWLANSTNAPWVNPSPNIRSLEAAVVYPGTGLFERTNVSVGRGTDAPFLTLGAPWIDGAAWVQAFAEENVPFVKLSPHRFTPTASTHQGKACGGILLAVRDLRSLDAVQLGLGLLRSLQRLYPQTFELKKADELLFQPKAITQLAAGVSAEEIARGWDSELAAFQKRREKYLLYR